MTDYFGDEFYTYLLFEFIYFVLGLLLEDQYANIQDDSFKKEFNETVFYRIIELSNIHLMKIIIFLIPFLISLFVLYFMFIYSININCRCRNIISIKEIINKYIYLYPIIIIIDIIQYTFIYPYITQYTSVLCMPIHWNTGQYLLIMSIFYKIKCKGFPNKSLINSILFSLISFSFSVYGFSKYYFARSGGYTNCFNNSISIVLFFFTPILKFIKDYSYQKLFKSTEINYVISVLIIWSSEEIIYIILRLIFIPKAGIIRGINKKTIFYGALSLYENIYNAWTLFKIPIPVKGFGKSISHLIYLGINFFGFFYLYNIRGYVIFSIVATLFEFLGYFICTSFIKNYEIFFKVYPSPKEIEEEKKKKKVQNNEIQLSNDSNYTGNNVINYQNKNKKEITNSDIEDVISKLNQDKNNIEKEKNELQKEKLDLSDENSKLNFEINKYKIKIRKIEEENQKLLEEINSKGLN